MNVVFRLISQFKRLEEIEPRLTGSPAWAVRGVVDQAPHLIGEPLLHMLAHVMQERRLLVVGSDVQINRVLFTLRGALHPFRWLHLFLSAPVPSQFGMFDLREVPFPMMAGISPMAPQANMDEEVVVVDLAIVAKRRSVRRFRSCFSPLHVPLAAVGPPRFVLPGHSSHLHSLRMLMRKSDDADGVCNAVQAVLQEIVTGIADVVKAYVRHIARAVDAEDRFDHACKRDMFVGWLHSVHRYDAFLESFLDTQMCVDLINEELKLYK